MLDKTTEKKNRDIYVYKDASILAINISSEALFCLVQFKTLNGRKMTNKKMMYGSLIVFSTDDYK